MKDFFIRLGHWLAHPPKWFPPLAAVVDILSILAAVLNAVYLDNETLAVASYSLIGITTCYLAFLFIRLLIGLYYSYLIPRLETSRLASFFPEGAAYRTIFFTGLSSLINLAFAGMNLFLGIAYSSIWYGSLAAYYFLLLTLRLSTVVSSYLAGKKLSGDPESFLRAKEKIRLVEASLLLPFDLLMGGAVTMMVMVGPPSVKGTVYAIAAAAYAFYKFIAAIVRLVNKGNRGDPVVATIRLVAFADALMSMVSLTVLMIATFDEGTDLLPVKAFVGFAAVALTAGLSISSIVRSAKGLIPARKDGI